jgi:hypothetical protein
MPLNLTNVTQPVFTFPAVWYDVVWSGELETQLCNSEQTESRTER